MTLNYVTLTLDLYDGQGNPVITGSALFTPTAQLTDTTNHELITQAAVPAAFHAGGLPAVKLLATDNGPPAPAGWAWTVTFTGVPGNPAAQTFLLPYGGGTANFSSVTAVAAPSALLGSTAAGVTVYPSGDTSGVTDTANITAAEATGRKVWFAAGNFWVTGLTKQSGTYWEGAGEGATFLNLAAGANADVVQGANFASLTMTGANTWGSAGIWDWGISRMCIDGNASGQSGVSYGLRVYGYGWTLENLVVRNCLTDCIWTEWGALATKSPVTAEDNVATATNVKTAFAQRHGWSHLGPSDCRFDAVETYQNNQAHGASGIGLWALNDQISNVMATASGMNGTSASGFTGTFTVQAAQLGGATDLYAASGTLKVTTSSGTATMTYTGKTATTFTGCTVTSGAGNFQTGNAVTSSAQKFTSNGLQTTACHSWSVDHTWAAVFDGQVSDGNSHWEGAQYGQILVRSSTNKAGGFVYDITGQFPAGCGIQLGDNGSTSGVPLSASLTANACDLRTRAYSFLHDTAAHSSLNWVSATQSSADIAAVTRQSGTYATTIAAGSNGVDLSTFTGGSPGTLFVASTQSIPNGAGTLTIATSNGNQTATFTGTNGNNGGSGGTSRSAGTQFTGVVAAGGTPGGSTMSTGGAVSLQNVGSLAIGGTADASSRIRVQCWSSSTALNTAASKVQETGPHNFDGGTSANAFTLRVNGTQQVNFSGASNQLQFPNSTDLRGYSDNFTTKTWEIPSATGIGQLAGLTLTGAAGSSSSALSALGAAAVQAASAVFKPSNPAAVNSTSYLMLGTGSTCTYTPAGSGKVLVTITCGFYTATSASTAFIKGAFGTGTAPVNGAADTGSLIGVSQQYRAASNSVPIPLAITDRLSLTPATTYWFDLAAASDGTNAATVKAIIMTFVELPG